MFGINITQLYIKLIWRAKNSCNNDKNRIKTNYVYIHILENVKENVTDNGLGKIMFFFFFWKYDWLKFKSIVNRDSCQKYLCGSGN